VKSEAKVLERLREAESFVGSPVTEMFMDNVNPEFRLVWLRSVRDLLKENGIEPENLSGRWRT
jgi:hypothetical protein